MRPFLLKAQPRAARNAAAEGGVCGGRGAGGPTGIGSGGVNRYAGAGSPPGRGGSSGSSVDMHMANSLSHSFSDSLSALSLDSGDESSQGYGSEMEGSVGDAWVSVSSAAAAGDSLVRSLSFESDGTFRRNGNGNGNGNGALGGVGGSDAHGDSLEAKIAQLNAQLKALVGGTLRTHTHYVLRTTYYVLLLLLLLPFHFVRILLIP